MAQAGRVRGIKPRASFGRNGARIIEARLNEMLCWRTAVSDPSRSTELHNMRIAAKRLRYALEIFVLCFPESKGALEDLTEIQESLGTIHDLDVMAEMLRQRLRALDVHLENEAIRVVAEPEGGERSADRVRAVLDAGAHDPQRVGLLSLLAEKVAERETRYTEFIGRWNSAGLDALAETVRNAVAGPEPSRDK